MGLPCKQCEESFSIITLCALFPTSGFSHVIYFMTFHNNFPVTFRVKEQDSLSTYAPAVSYISWN
jgi:hypothetical protein